MGTLRELSDDMRSATRWTSLWVPAFLVLLACGALGVRVPGRVSAKIPDQAGRPQHPPTRWRRSGERTNPEFGLLGRVSRLQAVPQENGFH
jgi:hypothetical protein